MVPGDDKVKLVSDRGWPGKGHSFEDAAGILVKVLGSCATGRGKGDIVGNRAFGEGSWYDGDCDGARTALGTSDTHGGDGDGGRTVVVATDVKARE